MQRMTLEQFRATNDAGAVLSVTLRAEGGGFEIQIETPRGTAQLVKSRDKSEVRRFVDPRKALLLLYELNIRDARVNCESWQPDEHEFERQPRPDRAEAMKAAHLALSHTEWLQKKLEVSAADDRPRVSHAQVMTDAQATINRKRKAHVKAG